MYQLSIKNDGAVVVDKGPSIINVTQFFEIAKTRFDELRDASAPFLEPPAKRSRVRMTESRNERAAEPKAEAEAEDCAGPGNVPGPLVASGRMGPGLCRAWD